MANQKRKKEIAILMIAGLGSNDTNHLVETKSRLQYEVQELVDRGFDLKFAVGSSTSILIFEK